MLTKQNMSLSDETIMMLRAVRTAVEECGGVNKVPITLDLMKVANNSQRMYMKQLRQEIQRKDRRNLKIKNKKHTKGKFMTSELKRRVDMKN